MRMKSLVMGAPAGEYQINFVGWGRVTQDPSISISARLLLTILIQHAGTDGVAFPSHDRLSLEMGLSPRQVSTLLNELRNRQLISWERKKRNGPSYYDFSHEVYFNTEGKRRKSTSAQSGSQLLLGTGSQLPPKVINEGSQLLLQEEFELLRGEKLTQAELSEFTALISKSSLEQVRSSIEELRRRPKKPGRLSVGYLGRVVVDIKEPVPPRPKFVPCGRNSCKNGFIQIGRTTKECKCHYEFNQMLADWKGRYAG
jgi:Helix-turn-helix domain